MKYYKKRKYAKKKRTYKYRGVRKAKAKKSGLRSLVRREIHRMAENKTNIIDSGTFIVKNFIGNTEVMSLLPTISQGTGVSNRTGNKIRVMNFKLKLIMNIFNLTAPTYQPFFFDVYIFKYKNWNQSMGSPPTGAMNEFLQVNNTSTSYGGFSSDYMRPVNDDQFQLIKKRRFHLYNPSNTASYYGGTATIMPVRMATFDLTKYVKKQWIYDDTTSTINNDHLFIAVGATQQDGSSANINIGSYQWMSELKYEDM